MQIFQWRKGDTFHYAEALENVCIFAIEVGGKGHPLWLCFQTNYSWYGHHHKDFGGLSARERATGDVAGKQTEVVGGDEDSSEQC